jgi:ADP-ribosyl-[dinitrogen reductase] hydrolase
MYLEEKFKGTILGCAVGDALGAPYEFAKGSVIAAVDDLVETYHHFHGFPHGHYTDDTQLTLALAATYTENNGFKGADFAKRLADFWVKDSIIGPGLACTDAVDNLKKGKSWKNSGAEENKAGNGAAMRASPVGLWNYDNLPQLKKDSIFHSQITHKDARAKAGAAAVAYAVAYNLNHEQVDTDELVGGMADFVKDINEEFSAFVQLLPGWLKMDEHLAVMEISCAGWVKPPRWLDMISPFVIPTVLIALYNFLRSPSDFRLTMERTLKTGGDVDTTGAIAGAISGSFNGASGIPQRLRSELWMAEMIEMVALNLCLVKHPGR